MKTRKQLKLKVKLDELTILAGDLFQHADPLWTRNYRNPFMIKARSLGYTCNEIGRFFSITDSQVSLVTKNAVDKSKT